MADATARYYHGQPGTAAGVLATVPASTQWNVRQIHLVNTAAVAATITLYLVTSVGSPGVANAILSTYSVPAGSVAQVSGLFPMSAGETIQGLQSSAGAITVLITGVTTT